MSSSDTKNKGYFFYGFLLFVVCAISAAALSFVARLTAPAIEKADKEKLEMLEKEILPAADSFIEISEGVKQGIAGQDKIPIGKVVVSSVRGYGGDLTIAVGISQKDESITGVKVLSHKETPGLGTKALAPEFLKQFVAKKFEEVKLKKDSPSGVIDGLTGATITSRAVTKAVADAFLKANETRAKDTDARTSATPKTGYRSKVSSATK